MSNETSLWRLVSSRIFEIPSFGVDTCYSLMSILLLAPPLRGNSFFVSVYISKERIYLESLSLIKLNKLVIVELQVAK